MLALAGNRYHLCSSSIGGSSTKNELLVVYVLTTAPKKFDKCDK